MLTLTPSEAIDFAQYVRNMGYNPLTDPVDAVACLNQWYNKIRPNKDKVYPVAKVLEQPI